MPAEVVLASRRLSEFQPCFTKKEHRMVDSALIVVDLRIIRVQGLDGIQRKRA
jgi:hypothetical protein